MQYSVFLLNFQANDACTSKDTEDDDDEEEEEEEEDDCYQKIVIVLRRPESPTYVGVYPQLTQVSGKELH